MPAQRGEGEVHPRVTRLMRQASVQTTMTFDAIGDCGLEQPLFSDLGKKVGHTGLAGDTENIEKCLKNRVGLLGLEPRTNGL